ncbi:MAG: hypothetical protein WCO75_04180, partial [Planctomycetota bacterium]
MTFTDFAAAYGLIITHLETGRWVRVPTEDHPRKQNGSYLFRGDHGFVRNYATMTDPVLWKDDRRLAPSRSEMAASRAEALKRREQEQAAAAKKEKLTLKRYTRTAGIYAAPYFVAYVKRLLEQGIEVTNRQRELIAPWDERFRGHIDGELDGELIEIKSVNDDRFETVKQDGVFGEH